MSKVPQSLNRVVVVRPGGNDTALVFDDVPKEEYGRVNTLIQNNNASIEQVMFVDVNGDLPRGTMAGGEFCGNATRALGYYLAKGKNTALTLSVSGATSLLQVDIKNGFTRLQMPIRNSYDNIIQISPTQTIVHIDGISHLILDVDDGENKRMQFAESIGAQKVIARELLQRNEMTSAPAAGVIALQKLNEEYSILPFVYVRDVDTFYFETACGSGSVAAGLAMAYKNRERSFSRSFLQPSGLPIKVDIESDDEGFKSAHIDGPVNICYEGPMSF